jgi:hypothetical protein
VKPLDTITKYDPNSRCDAISSSHPIREEPDENTRYSDKFFIMKDPDINSYPFVGVKPNDVLSGRGNAAKKHEGNVHFLELVQAVKHFYVSLPPNKKMPMSELVIRAIKSLRPPGRFLKEKETDTGVLMWEEISTKEALKKTSQALREGQPDHKMSGLVPQIHDNESLKERLNEIWVSLPLCCVSMLIVLLSQRHSLVTECVLLATNCR